MARLYKGQQYEEELTVVRQEFIPNRKMSLLLDVALLFCHLFFAAWYYQEHMQILFLYNLFSIAVFLFGFYLVWKQWFVLLLFINFSEIYIFMVVNVVCLGWELGFQYYCFSLLISAFLVEFFMKGRRMIRNFAIIYAIMNMAAFSVMRIWTYGHEPVYTPDGAFPKEGMYLVNVLLVFVALIFFLLTFTQTVYGLEGRLSYVAAHDALTGLRNRGSIQRLVQEISYDESDFWIAILDIDHFKMINDGYGHSAGDEVLRKLGMIFGEYEEKKPGLKCGRMGGEEFLLLYEPDGQPEGDTIFEELRREIEAAVVICDGKTIDFTATIGVVRNNECKSADEMILLADRRLYDGKKTGRNKVIKSE